jgi:hypothetical protein
MNHVFIHVFSSIIFFSSINFFFQSVQLMYNHVTNAIYIMIITTQRELSGMHGGQHGRYGQTRDVTNHLIAQSNICTPYAVT